MWWFAIPVANAAPTSAPWTGPRCPWAERTATQSSRAAVSTAPERTSATPLHFQKRGETAIAQAPTSAPARVPPPTTMARCRTPTVAPPRTADASEAFHATVPKGRAHTSRRPRAQYSG